MWNDAAAEVPFTDGGDNFWRWVISNSTDYGGWSVTTSPMMLMSTIIGSYWNWVEFQGLSPAASLAQPQLSLAFADKGDIFRPLVQVQCEAYTTNDTLTHEIELPNDQLRAAQGTTYNDAVWTIPRNYTNISTSDLLDYDWNLYWTRLPLNDYEKAPSAGLIFVMPNDEHTKAVVPCSVLAHWVPSDLSVMPKTDRNIHDTHSNPLEVINSSYVNLSPQTQIHLSDNWWALLLPSDSDPTTIDSAMHGITMGPAGDECLDSFSGGTQGLAYRVSTLMGMFFTDAIARYTPITSHVVVQNPANGGKPFAQDLGNFNMPFEEIPAGYASWLHYAESYPDYWREATITVRRYGYGWCLDGLLVKVATLALLVQALMALTHIAVTTAGRWTSKAWDSIGSMIILALRSQRPAVPVDYGTGEEHNETWAEIVSVRVVDKDLELQVGLHRAKTLQLIKRS